MIIGNQGLQSGGTLTYQTARVYTSNEFSADAEWTEQTHLEPLMWVDCAAPQIPQATFLYRYGNISWEDAHSTTAYPPIDLGNKFVRIQVEGAGEREEIWQGYITDMSLVPTGEDTGSGDQIITAYGLEIFFKERRRAIRRSWVKADSRRDDIVQIDYVPAFNQRMNKGNDYAWGNCSPSEMDMGGVSFPLFDCTGTYGRWTAQKGLNLIIGAYLYDLPFQLTVGGQTDLLPGIMLHGCINGMTPYDAIMSIIPRERGICWSLPHNWPDTPTITVKSVFENEISYIDSDGDVVSFSGNDSVYEVNFDDYLDVDLQNVVFSTLRKYKTLNIYGERVRSIFTGDIGPKSNVDRVFIPGWSADRETQFKELEPISTEVTAKRTELDLARSRMKDALGKVYSYFVLNPLWDGMINGTSVFPVTDGNGGANTQQVQWPLNAGNGFMRVLPIQESMPDTKEGFGEGTVNDSVVPFGIVVYDNAVTGGKWIYLNESSLVSSAVPDFALRMVDSEYAIEIPNGGSYLADGHWSEASGDPETQALTWKTPVFDYEDIRVTIGLITDLRLRVSGQIGSDSDTGTLELDVPGAHLWIIHPETVVGLTQNGTLTLAQDYYDNGSVRDDSGVLRSVYALASQWYSVERRLITYSFKTICSHLPIGSIIESVFTGGVFANCHTIVTSKTYNWQAGSVTVNTGWADIDLVGMVTSRGNYR